VGDGVDTKCLESGDKDEDGCPAVVEREGEMDPEDIVHGLGLVELFHDIVNVGHGRADKERKEEREDIVLVNPDVDVNAVEDGEEGEAPADAVDDDLFCRYRRTGRRCSRGGVGG